MHCKVQEPCACAAGWCRHQQLPYKPSFGCHWEVKGLSVHKARFHFTLRRVSVFSGVCCAQGEWFYNWLVLKAGELTVRLWSNCLSPWNPVMSLDVIPSNFAVWGQVYRWEICRLLTWVMQKMEICVRMMEMPVLHHIPWELTGFFTLCLTPIWGFQGPKYLLVRFRSLVIYLRFSCQVLSMFTRFPPEHLISLSPFSQFLYFSVLDAK